MSPRGGRPYSVREAKKTILVMCEGRNTERIYFNALKSRLRAGYLDVVSDKHQGFTVEAMLKELKRRKKIGNIPDEVFCVFDLDALAQPQKAVVAQLEAWQSSLVRAVPSRPCFEYWLLAHFEHTRAPYVGTPGGKTACDQVIDRLRAHVPNYQKSDAAIIRRFIEDDQLLQRGLANYARCAQDLDANPCTRVGSLVRNLLGLGEYN